MSLRTQLIRATAGIHSAFEGSPLFAEIIDEAPSRARYVAWLRVLEVVLRVHATERARARGRAAPERDDDGRRLSRLRADLVVQDEVPTPVSAAVKPMLALVEELRRSGRAQPRRLVGFAYALEMSLRVGPRLYEGLRARLGARASGLAFLSLLAREADDDARALEQRLEALTLSASAQEQVVDAARRGYSRLLEIVEALGSRDPGARELVRALNSDAGDHATTSDPREVMAAVDAGLKTWAKNPYYEARYGARGLRFTRSDSAWLVLLADTEERARQRQLEWLNRLLIARGMPSVLLEAHLLDLYKELRAAVPERAGQYAGLAALSRQLQEQRLAALPSFDALAAEAPRHETLGDIGRLLLSAMVDERRGHAGATAHVEGWLSRSGLCTAEWLDAARAFLVHAAAIADATGHQR